jgi:hypothetical protein
MGINLSAVTCEQVKDFGKSSVTFLGADYQRLA